MLQCSSSRVLCVYGQSRTNPREARTLGSLECSPNISRSPSLSRTLGEFWGPLEMIILWRPRSVVSVLISSSGGHSNLLATSRSLIVLVKGFAQINSHSNCSTTCRNKMSPLLSADCFHRRPPRSPLTIMRRGKTQSSGIMMDCIFFSFFFSLSPFLPSSRFVYATSLFSSIPRKHQSVINFNLIVCGGTCACLCRSWIVSDRWDHP